MKEIAQDFKTELRFQRAAVRALQVRAKNSMYFKANPERQIYFTRIEYCKGLVLQQT